MIQLSYIIVEQLEQSFRFNMDVFVNNTMCSLAKLEVEVVSNQLNSCVTYNASWLNISITDDISEHCEIFSFVINAGVIGVECAIGLVANVLTFIVFQKEEHKSSTSFLLQSQAVIDFILMGFSFILYSVPSFVRFTGLLKGFNSVYPYVLVYVFPCAMMTHTASVWTTALVGINRYIVVRSPYTVNHVHMRKMVYKQFAGVILAAVCYNIPRFFAAHVEWQMDAENTAMINYADSTEMGQHYIYTTVYEHVLYLIFVFGVPAVSLSVISALLINIVMDMRRKDALRRRGTQGGRRSPNPTIMLIAVFMVFLGCQGPAWTNQIMWDVLSDSSRQCGGFQFYFRQIANALLVLNSAINFFIYKLFNASFRMAFVAMCCRSARPGWILGSRATRTAETPAASAELLEIHSDGEEHQHAISFHQAMDSKLH